MNRTRATAQEAYDRWFSSKSNMCHFIVTNVANSQQTMPCRPSIGMWSHQHLRCTWRHAQLAKALALRGWSAALFPSTSGGNCTSTFEYLEAAKQKQQLFPSTFDGTFKQYIILSFNLQTRSVTLCFPQNKHLPTPSSPSSAPIMVPSFRIPHFRGAFEAISRPFFPVLPTYKRKCISSYSPNAEGSLPALRRLCRDTLDLPATGLYLIIALEP